MKKFFQKKFYKIITIIACILPIQTFADDLPFIDIDKNSEYYSAISKLYEAWVIYDDWSHKFNPNETMNRDFFVSLATQIGCKECLTPSAEDIIKYNNSPFVDLSKSNKFYYCIAYAHDNWITQWYNIDPYNNLAYCENWQKFSSSPFCENNSTTRIEAAGMLLRQAKLWNDSLNSSNFAKNENFSDIDEKNYWYGYAQKSLEMWIIQKKSDWSVWYSEKITKWEFAKMSAIILDYSQCSFISKTQNSSASYIEIIDKENKKTNRTSFEEWEKFSFTPNWEIVWKNFEWTATNNSGKTVTWNEKNFDWSQLTPWIWHVNVKIIDPISGKTISNPSVTVIVTPNQDDTDWDWVKNNDDKCPTIVGPASNNGCPLTENDDSDWDWVKNNDDKCPTIPGPASNNGCPISDTIWVSLIPNPSITYIGNPITFTPHINWNWNNLIYDWDFGDGNRNSNSGEQKHSYNKDWTYKVTLTVTDKNTWNTWQSTVIIRITNNKDSDWDWTIDDEDTCPLVKWVKENNGCPKIRIHNYGCSINEILSGNWNCKHVSLISNSGSNFNNNFGFNWNWNWNWNWSWNWNPSSGSTNWNNDNDWDWIPNNLDHCPKNPWLPEWNGCPNPSNYQNISNNICLAKKLENQWLIIGEAVCNSCPCNNNINITSTLRECDIIFPTILSPDKKTIYSRGNFYLLK